METVPLSLPCHKPTAEPGRVRSVVQLAFKVTAMLPDSARVPVSGGYRVNHAATLQLADRDRRVQGVYNAREAGAVDSLRADLRALAPRRCLGPEPRGDGIAR
ncbi:MAG: hypothetical protein ABEJ46_06060 [Gemmatimonadota bacterium]